MSRLAMLSRPSTEPRTPTILYGCGRSSLPWRPCRFQSCSSRTRAGRPLSRLRHRTRRRSSASGQAVALPADGFNSVALAGGCHRLRWAAEGGVPTRRPVYHASFGDRVDRVTRRRLECPRPRAVACDRTGRSASPQVLEPSLTATARPLRRWSRNWPPGSDPDHPNVAGSRRHNRRAVRGVPAGLSPRTGRPDPSTLVGSARVWPRMWHLGGWRCRTARARRSTPGQVPLPHFRRR